MKRSHIVAYTTRVGIIHIVSELLKKDQKRNSEHSKCCVFKLFQTIADYFRKKMNG